MPKKTAIDDAMKVMRDQYDYREEDADRLRAELTVVENKLRQEDERCGILLDRCIALGVYAFFATVLAVGFGIKALH